MMKTQLQDHTKGVEPLNYRDLIQDSIDYIEENLKTRITADELAQRTGFSLYHYCRVFQAITGMSVKQYTLRRRLLHAIYAIRCGSTGIDAALTYGFDTYAGFYRAFQREFGCTPSTFVHLYRVKQPYRLNLNKEEHIMVTQKKAAQMLKHWNLESETITPIYFGGTGAQNDNACYVGTDHVLKFTANPGKLENHIPLSEAIERGGLCAASPVATTDGRTYIQDGELYFCLTRRLPGSQLTAATLYDDPAKGRFVGQIIGKLHLALRSVEAAVNESDLYATVRDWAMPAAREALGLSEHFCRDYLDAFGALCPSLPRQIVHLDPNPGNIICAGDNWGFIDFELSERNVRIYDPCYAATAVLSESFGRNNEAWMEIYRAIICGYDSVVHLTQEEFQAIPYVLLANQLVCVAWFAGQEKYAELFATNKRMTSWLVDTFEDLKF